MTMVDMRCDVCQRDPKVHPAVGVACTSIPYSCAYCRACATIAADPIIVFEVWYDTVGEPDRHRSPDNSYTFLGDSYITYRDWYVIRSRNHDQHVLDWHLEQYFNQEEPSDN